MASPTPSFPVHALRACFAAFVVLVLVLALWPSPEQLPLQTGWDKADHVAAFAFLGLLGLLAWPGDPARVLAGLLLYGVLIEVLQSFTPSRQADWHDVVADAVGSALAMLLLTTWRRWRDASASA